MKMEKKVVLITGGNAGIGLSLADQLLGEDPSLQLCLACRNKMRAEAARQKLQLNHPGAFVDVVIVDVGNLASVYYAAEQIRNRYQRLDYLFLNAGIMPGVRFSWHGAWTGLLSNPSQMFRTGQGLVTQSNRINADGLKEVFATNVFGHFILLQELVDLLGGPDSTTQIVWTSSSNANKCLFSLDDIQNTQGKEPYSVSKYCIDLLSVELNNRLNAKGVYSHSTCPGFVMTGMTAGILPSWFWTLVLPILMLIRFLVPSVSISPENGAEVLRWLYWQKPDALDPLCKYHSNTDLFGNRYVTKSKMDVDLDIAEEFYCKLEELQKNLEINLDLGKDRSNGTFQMKRGHQDFANDL